jgi:hypothetical protein
MDGILLREQERYCQVFERQKGELEGKGLLLTFWFVRWLLSFVRRRWHVVASY